MLADAVIWIKVVGTGTSPTNFLCTTVYVDEHTPNMIVAPISCDILSAYPSPSRSRKFEDARFCKVPDLLELQASCGPVERPMSEHCKANIPTIRLTKVPKNSAAYAP